MGKPIIQQRRGKGSLTYRFPTHRYKAHIKYPITTDNETTGKIDKFLHSIGYTAPLVKIRLGSGKCFYNLATDTTVEGQSISLGNDAEIAKGNVLQLSRIPEGTLVFNLEVKPGDGGKLVRSAGGNAKVMKYIEEKDKVSVLMPSKKLKLFNSKSRATIGTIAGGGKKDKPILKAGKMYHIKKAKNKLYPRTSAVKMNAVDHPFGGGRGKVIGKPKTPPRFAPAGRKVGLLRASRTGRRKKK